MSLEVGSIVEGQITGITKFGAFVALPENKTGLIHISEVSNAYVKDVHDFLKEHDKFSATKALFLWLCSRKNPNPLENVDKILSILYYIYII